MRGGEGGREGVEKRVEGRVLVKLLCEGRRGRQWNQPRCGH